MDVGSRGYNLSAFKCVMVLKNPRILLLVFLFVRMSALFSAFSYVTFQRLKKKMKGGQQPALDAATQEDRWTSQIIVADTLLYQAVLTFINQDIPSYMKGMSYFLSFTCTCDLRALRESSIRAMRHVDIGIHVYAAEGSSMLMCKSQTFGM